ncbi:MAG: hypothetical protein HOP17_13825 [Acidobacteria bacterium]|nr:hypothetical protein [Acidobacteriota bacterium]
MSKGVMINVSITPLLTRGLLHQKSADFAFSDGPNSDKRGRVSKGVMINVSITPLLTRGLVHQKNAGFAFSDGSTFG